jgi:hypothetical protein
VTGPHPVVVVAAIVVGAGGVVVLGMLLALWPMETVAVGVVGAVAASVRVWWINR